MKRIMTAFVALLLILSTAMTAHAQGPEWETLNDEALSLYKQGAR